MFLHHRWQGLRIWVRRWFAQAGRPTATRRKTALCLERLEDRLTPSTAAFLVSDTSDSVSDHASLRFAVAQANADTTDTSFTIQFAAALAGSTINLGSSLALSNTHLSVTIDGTNAPGLTIAGGGSKSNFSVLSVAAGVSATLNDLTINQGHAAKGGGIATAGTLTVENSILTGNAATTGGGIFVSGGTLTLTSSILSGNEANNSGGGIFVHAGTLTLTNSTLSGNTAEQETLSSGGGISGGGTTAINNCIFVDNTAKFGGGINVHAGSATLSNSTLSGNSAATGGGIDVSGGTMALSNDTLDNDTGPAGGGLFVEGDATVTVGNSTLSGNSATFGAGIQVNSGTLALSNSTLSGNSANNNGGGIAVFGGTLTLSNSTLNGNSGEDTGGGGLYVTGGAVTLSNSTLSGNSAGDGSGGGIYLGGGTVTLSDCTLSANSAPDGSGGGIDNNNGALTLQNSIVSGNAPNDINGSITHDLGNNLLGTALQGTATPPANNPDIFSDTPGLAPLGNYGGPTQTLALLPGSPALGKGNGAAGTVLPTDQRGFQRLLGAAIDIGAYQTQATPFLVTTAVDPGGLSGLLSLREAVNLANAYANNDDPADITFAAGLSGQTITLTEGELLLNGFPNSGAAPITLDAGGRAIAVSAPGGATALEIALGVQTILTGGINFGPTTIDDNGTLTVPPSGTGTVRALTVTLGGIVEVGGGGTLTAASVNFNSGSTLQIDVQSQAAGAGFTAQFGQLAVKGGLTVTNTSPSADLNVNLEDSNVANVGLSIPLNNIITFTGAKPTGVFNTSITGIDHANFTVSLAPFAATSLSATLNDPPAPLLVAPSGSFNGQHAFTTIQAAINAAKKGDIIEVAAGAYTGNVTVNKALTIEGAQFGQEARTGRTNPALESIVNGSFIVTAANVAIDGFTIQNKGSAAAITVNPGATHAQISNNILLDAKIGLVINDAKNAAVFDNLFSNETSAALLLENLAASNLVADNLIHGGLADGIDLTNSSGNTLIGNTVDGNQGHGILLTSSSNNTLDGNTVAGNKRGGITVGAGSKSNTIIGNQ